MSSTISVPQYPNVPIAPGVPPVARPSAAFQVVNAADTAAILVADAVIAARLFAAPSWGIFNSAMQPVITGDSTLSVAFRRQARVSDYPIEQGGFQSYNKVQTPYDSRLTFSCGGAFSVNSVLAAASALTPTSALNVLTGEAARTAFLASIDAAEQSTDLYNIVTPEVTYPNANVTAYDYERTQRDGVTLLTVDVVLEEIRVAPAPQFSNTTTSTPSGANPVNGGTVQTVPVTQEPLSPAQSNKLSTFQFT